MLRWKALLVITFLMWVTSWVLLPVLFVIVAVWVVAGGLGGADRSRTQPVELLRRRNNVANRLLALDDAPIVHPDAKEHFRRAGQLYTRATVELERHPRKPDARNVDRALQRAAWELDAVGAIEAGHPVRAAPQRRTEAAAEWTLRAARAYSCWAGPRLARHYGWQRNDERVLIG